MTEQPQMPIPTREQMEKYWDAYFSGESMLVYMKRKAEREMKKLDEYDELLKLVNEHLKWCRFSFGYDIHKKELIMFMKEHGYAIKDYYDVKYSMEKWDV